MAKNEVYRVGQYVPVPVPDTAPGSGVSLLTTSGVALRVGGLNLVTVTQKGEDNYPQNASGDLGGAHLFPVTVAGGPATFGTPVYLITATGLLSTVATGATFFGYILDDTPIANGTQVPAVVKIVQSAPAAA